MLPLSVGDGQRHFILYAATTDYNVEQVLLDLAIGGGTPQFFVASHDTIEIYYSSPKFLLSAGGVYQEGLNLDYQGVPRFLRSTVQNLVSGNEFDGWAQPTTLVPTEESSATFAI